ncbi:SurA N-terminal domain-containing protein [Acididesulfobacillus acetoxydans]|uniref:SurA N-terminal domain-containing protein n=1 Tax=Acididesulfobacillus acetoxydans TaxID=1561005 RepID=UPI0035582477
MRANVLQDIVNQVLLLREAEKEGITVSDQEIDRLRERHFLPLFQIRNLWY